MGDSSKSWEPGAHCKTYCQFNRLESLFQMHEFSLNLFQAVLLVCPFFMKLAWLRVFAAWLLRVFFAALVLTLGERDPMNLVSFRDFLALF